MMHSFAESLARNVDAANDREILLLPARQPAVEYGNIAVTELGQAACRERRPLSPFVVHDEWNPRVRHQFGYTEFDLAARQRGSVGDLARVEFAPLTDIEHGI